MRRIAVTRLIATTIAALGLAAGAAAAQDVESKSRTKITVEEGKDVRVTGCVTRSPEGAFILSNAAGKDGVLGTYTLVPKDDDDDDLEELVGHRVEVEGKAADKGTGRVKIETKSEVERGGGDTRKRESETEIEGDLQGLPFLGIKSIRSLSSVCR
jgi:hypothetical protein